MSDPDDDCPYDLAAEKLALLPNPSMGDVPRGERAKRISTMLHNLAEMAISQKDPARAYALETILLITSGMQVVPPTEPQIETIVSVFGPIKSGTA